MIIAVSLTDYQPLMPIEAICMCALKMPVGIRKKIPCF